MKSAWLKHLKGLNQAVTWMTKGSAKLTDSPAIELAQEAKVSPNENAIRAAKSTDQNDAIKNENADQKAISVESPLVSSLVKRTGDKNRIEDVVSTVTDKNTDEITGKNTVAENSIIESDPEEINASAADIEKVEQKNLEAAVLESTAIESDVSDDVVESFSEDESEEWEEGVEETAMSLEEALKTGLCVTISELETYDQGWLYRGIPVMVFGVDVVECDDQALRESFRKTIHLISCCNALDNAGQVVWIGTEIAALSSDIQHHSEHLCHYCLQQINYLGYRHLGDEDQTEIKQAFDFYEFSAKFSELYFKKGSIQYWNASGGLSKLGDDAFAEGQCSECGWYPESKYSLLDGDSLGLNADVCIVCAV